jgi:putative transposase
MMAERGVIVDHATVHRWALKILPVLALVFRRRKRAVGSSWRVDETCVKVGGQWRYLYRAVDRLGQTVDFLLTAHRDVAAARRFFEREPSTGTVCPRRLRWTKAAPTPQP